MPKPLVPNALQSEDEHLRFHHLDLDRRDYLDLWREMIRVQYAVAHQDDADPWLYERLTVLLKELRRRRPAR